MKAVFLGKTIRDRRKELGLTQEQLCEGICEPATLSRFENGKLTPSYNRINTLLRRLGLPDCRYYALVSKHEEEVRRLNDQIWELGNNFSTLHQDEETHERERLRGLELLEQLEAVMDEDDQITRQTVLYYRALLGKPEGKYTPEEKRDILLQAILLTCPGFTETDLSRAMYCCSEIEIICCLAWTYFNSGQLERAIGLLSRLLQYMQDNSQRLAQPAGSCMIRILLHYTVVLARAGRFGEALEIAEQCRRCCLQSYSYAWLPILTLLMAVLHSDLGNREESRSLFRQAYYTCKVVGNEYTCGIIKDTADYRLQMEFED